MADEAQTADSERNRLTCLSDCPSIVCVTSGVCPHDIFLNSKFDLRACTNKHDDAAKQQSVTRTHSGGGGRLWIHRSLTRSARSLLHGPSLTFALLHCFARRFEKEPLAVRMGVERQWLSYVEDKVIRPCDRRVAQGEARVAASNARDPVLAATNAALSEVEKKIAESAEIKQVDEKQAEIAKNISVLQLQIDEMKKAAAPAAAPAVPAAGDAAPGDAGVAAAADTPAAAVTPAAAAAAAVAPPTPVAAVSADSIATAALQKLVEGLQAEKLELDMKRNELVLKLNDGKPLSAVPGQALSVAAALAAASKLQTVRYTNKQLRRICKRVSAIVLIVFPAAPCCVRSSGHGRVQVLRVAHQNGRHGGASA